MSNAVIYARYSSAGQREVSIEQQINKCRAYAKANGITIIHEYYDKAMTGRNVNRPQFQKMIADSASKEFQYVIVYATDRFSRQKYENAIYKQKLYENGVKVLSATEPITNDAPGILVEGIFESLAMYYSAELSAKIHRGYENNAEHFLAPGSVPFGFNRSKDGHYVVNEEEAQIVREIFNRFLSGEALISICRSLNERGIKTRHGTEWNRSSFNKMLTNERYIGTYIWKDKKTEDAIPAILDKQTFWAAQALLPEKKRPRSSPTRRRTENGIYLLTGKFFCGQCGCPMHGISGTGRNNELYYYYKCKENNCKKIPRTTAETIVFDAISAVCLSDDAIDWIAEQTVNTSKFIDNASDEELLQKQLAEAQKRQENLVKAIESGIINDTIKANMEAADADIAEAKAKLALIEQEKEEALSKDDVISYLELLKEMDFENPVIREHLIDAFVTKVVLNEDSMDIFFDIKNQHCERQATFDSTDFSCVSYSETQWRWETAIRNISLCFVGNGFMLHVA